MKELEQLSLEILKKTSECLYLLSYSFDNHFSLIDANEVFEEVFGELVIRCKGKNLESFTDFATAKRLQNCCKACTNSYEPRHEKLLISTKEGLQYHDCTFCRTESAPGTVEILCTHRLLCDDHTVRTENLQLSKLLNQAEKSSFMGHFVVYPDRKCVVLSESLQQLLGLNRVEITLKEGMDLLLPEEVALIKEQFLFAFREQTVFFARTGWPEKKCDQQRGFHF